MNTGVGSVFYGDEEPDIAEVSPNGHYVRYHEIVEDGRGGKVGYKGFDEDYGRDVTWNKIQVVDSFRAEQLLRDSDRFLKPFKHGNIIKYYSSWVDHETSHINIITESFTSGCLRKFRKKHKSVETNAIKKWARQVLQGLCFLHTHDPPIVHGSLTCDNIFINGNTGEVKIGDPGLGNILQHPPLELLEEVFNEDFDVYLFGMCMLELATSQIPFSDFETVRDMYRKRIESGTMPDALAKVKDAQFKQFIENCLVSGSAKVSITELLEDSFLQTPTLPSSGRDPLVSVFELRRIIGKSEFRLKGETTLKGLVWFKLLVDNLRGKKLDIEFEFDPQADTTLKVAGEMIDAFDLSSEDIILVAELMDRLIFRMVPCWKPSLVDFSAVNNSYGDLVPAF